MVLKRVKRNNSGQNHEVVWVQKQGGTGTTIQKPIGIGTKASGTGTTMQKVFGTGTKHSGTGTTLPKCPDFGDFAYLSPNLHTDCIGTLVND